MYKHILAPTDGSALALTAVTQAIKLAKVTNAKLTFLTVGAPFHVFAADNEVVADARPEYEARAKLKADNTLSVCEQAANKAGVPCQTRFVTAEHPYEAIVRTAEDAGCDLIMMASHSRQGLKGLLLGSETQKVLAHSKTPVLVYR